MRELIYAVEGKAANLHTVALDEPSQGGASHKYLITEYKEGTKVNVTLDFQNGPINEDGNGVNGIQGEDLLAILIDRYEGFQSGPYACDENERALTHLKQAMQALNDRTRKRIARGVEGTHKV